MRASVREDDAPPCCIVLATIALVLMAVVDDAPSDIEPSATPQEAVESRVSLEEALALRGFAVTVETLDGAIVEGELRAVDDESLRVATSSGDVSVPLARVRALRKRDNTPPPTNYAIRRPLPRPDAAQPSLANATAFAGAGGCIGCVTALAVSVGAGVVLLEIGQGALAAPVIATSAAVVPAMGAAGGAFIATHEDPHGVAVATAAGVGALAGMFVGGGSALAISIAGAPAGCAQVPFCTPSVDAVGAIFASAALGTGVGAAAFAAGTHLIMYDTDERSRILE